MTADLVDPYGRTVRDLRISVTDRCNFRCSYCMPAEGMQWLPRSELLTFEEIERIARVFVERFGVDGIRLTGGEPTVRAHLPVLVGKLAALERRPVDDDQRRDVPARGRGSAGGGPRPRATSRSTRCAATGSSRSPDATSSSECSTASPRRRRPGFDPVKINVVLERGMNDDEIVDFATWGREQRVAVRFIEFMPLDASGEWARDKVVSQDEILDAISAVYPLVPAPARGAAPADRWLYADGLGDVGVIPSVTKPFCGDCDRVRLTAEGQLRTCLFETREFDLRAIVRSGGSDDDLAAEIVRAVGTKWAGHAIGQVTFIRPKRSMSQIGG